MSLMSLNRKLVSGEVRKLLFGAVKRGREKIMASCVEVLFIDEGDSVNKGNGFILNFFVDWELDSTMAFRRGTQTFIHY